MSAIAGTDQGHKHKHHAGHKHQYQDEVERKRTTHHHHHRSGHHRHHGHESENLKRSNSTDKAGKGRHHDSHQKHHHLNIGPEACRNQPLRQEQSKDKWRGKDDKHGNNEQQETEEPVVEQMNAFYFGPSRYSYGFGEPLHVGGNRGFNHRATYAPNWDYNPRHSRYWSFQPQKAYQGYSSFYEDPHDYRYGGSSSIFQYYPGWSGTTR